MQFESAQNLIGMKDLLWGGAFDLKNFLLSGNWSLLEQFKILSFAAACPTSDSVWNDCESKPKGDTYDTEGIIARYNRTNSVMKRIVWPRAQKLNPPLYKELVQTYDRFESEKDKIFFEEQSVPSIHRDKMSKMSTPWGYATSRLFILLYDEKNPKAPKDGGKRAIWAIDILEKSLKLAKTPSEFLAIFADQTLKSGIKLNRLMEHVFEPAKLKEENNKIMYHQLLKDVQSNDNTKDLWATIQELRKNPPAGWSPGWKLMINLLEQS